MKEIWLDEIREVAKEIGEPQKTVILATLRSTPTDLDHRRREEAPEWRRGAIYFHSLQDTMFAARMARPDEVDVIRGMQACFVKDLDLYFEGFPESEDQEMRRLFQNVFDAGTSVLWEQDREFIKNFDSLCWKLDEEVIRPWVQETK